MGEVIDLRSDGNGNSKGASPVGDVPDQLIASLEEVFGEPGPAPRNATSKRWETKFTHPLTGAKESVEIVGHGPWRFEVRGSSPDAFWYVIDKLLTYTIGL